ncbi:MAG: hypothetical protein ACRDD1_09900 [Planctomycetia bacterium]
MSNAGTAASQDDASAKAAKQIVWSLRSQGLNKSGQLIVVGSVLSLLSASLGADLLARGITWLDENFYIKRMFNGQSFVIQPKIVLFPY